MLTKTNGGFNDRDMKALAVNPCGVPSLSLVVMIVTPVAKWLITRRNSCGSMVMLSLDTVEISSTANRPSRALSMRSRPAAWTEPRESKDGRDEGGQLMAVQNREASNTLEQYIAAVRSVWGDGKDPQLPFKVAALMEKLFASTKPDDPWMAELIREEAFEKNFGEILITASFKWVMCTSRATATPHDHGPCWVVYGAQRRHRDYQIQTHRRRRATRRGNLRKTGSIVLRPGWSFSLRGDIHSTNAVQGPGVVFRFLTTTWTKLTVTATTWKTEKLFQCRPGKQSPMSGGNSFGPDTSLPRKIPGRPGWNRTPIQGTQRGMTEI
jgi:hypothetical protein